MQRTNRHTTPLATQAAINGPAMPDRKRLGGNVTADVVAYCADGFSVEN